VLFANFAEALAEGRSRAQAASLRGMKRDTVAKLLQQPHFGSAWIPMRASELRKGVVICGGRRHDCA
jgi:K+-transporting ATPase ATPase B chain